MLQPRIIPTLLLRDNGLVKTIKFRDYKYVGDPINAIRIFNEKQVDELFFLDIDATRYGRRPNFDLIKKISRECEMPLGYGGGIKTLDDARRMIDLGVEKVALSSLAIEQPDIMHLISQEVGAQSVTVIIDVKKGLFGEPIVYTHNGSRRVTESFADIISIVQAADIGEVVINNIDRDGVMKGYDFKLVEKVRQMVKGPLTVLGGAGSKEDIFELVERFGVIGAGAGSLFVFNGPYKAVLINYLNDDERMRLRSQVEKI